MPRRPWSREEFVWLVIVIVGVLVMLAMVKR